MSNDTPMAGDWWCPSCKEALDGSRVTYDERCDTCGTPVSVAGEGDIARLERENASLREELTTRERLYKEQWQRAEQTEADLKRARTSDEANFLRWQKSEARALTAENKVAWQEVEIADLRDDVKRHMRISSECEERALAAEKDAGRYRFLCEGEYQDDGEMWTAISNTSIKDEWDAEIDAAIAGAKHD